MAVKFIEDGSGATQDFTHWSVGKITGGTGTITSDSKSLSDSNRSILSASGVTSAGAFAVVGNRTILADAGRRISFFINFNGTPTASGGGADFCAINTNADLAVFGVSLNTSLQLVLTGNGSSALATGSQILVANTNYRILIVYTITSTTVNSFKIYVNGALEISATNVTLPNASSDTLYFGFGTYNAPGANMNIYGSHFYVDDQTSGDPGPMHCTSKRIFSNGTTTNYNTQIGSGGSGYGTGHAPQVNERPLSQTNGWSVIGVGSAVTEEYNVEGIAVGDNDLTDCTIIDYVGWLYTKALAGETGQIIVNGVNTNISITTSPAMFKQIAGSNNYPAGTGSDIGEITSTTVTTVSLYEGGIIVAYLPPKGNRTTLNINGGVNTRPRAFAPGLAR